MQSGTYHSNPVETFSTPQAQTAMQMALTEVRAQFGASYPLIIDGEPVITGGWTDSTNPSDPDQVVGRAADAGRTEIDAALQAAWNAFDTWREYSQEARSRVLLKAAKIMRDRKLELAAWEVYEIGKNWIEADADVAEAIDFVEYYARAAMRYAGTSAVALYPQPNEDNEAFYTPLGAGAVIPPWNFPGAILTGMMMGPVAVGNTVVVKPAPDTPVIAAKIVEILHQAGLPRGVVNLLPGPVSVIGDYLVEHPQTRFINFTGSMAVGLRINELAARVGPRQHWIKRVYVELGGKDALIVDETADLDWAAVQIVSGAYGFQGQKCSATSRLIVIDAVHDLLMEKVLERAERLSVGPAEENPDLGPLANQKQGQKVMDYIHIGVGEGGLKLGGRRLEGKGFFVVPTIFDGVSGDARIAQEEIFGPVLSTIRVPDFETALEVANSTAYGLTGGVFSRDRARLELSRGRFQVGNLYFNRKITGAVVGAQPFGGFNLSGTDSKAGGPDYLGLFLQMKAVTERY